MTTPPAQCIAWAGHGDDESRCGKDANDRLAFAVQEEFSPLPELPTLRMGAWGL